MSTSLPDFTDLKKASRNAAFITLAGAVIALGAIAFSMWRLADTEAKLADEKQQVSALDKKKIELDKSVGDLELTKQELQKQIKEAQREKADFDNQLKEIAATIPPPPKNDFVNKPAPLDQIKLAVADRNDLERQMGVVRQEAGLIRDAFKNRFTDTKENLKLWNEVPGYHRIMATVLVTPASTYIEQKKASSPTGKWYDFKLYLEFPRDKALADAIKRDIKTVTYEMNHPYLKEPPLVTRDASNLFAMHYKGAGTLRNVVVRIEFNDKDLPVALDYDMTKAHPTAAAK